MQTIVYLSDGSIEETSRAAEHVANGIARYATQEEIDSYEKLFWDCDNSMID